MVTWAARQKGRNAKHAGRRAAGSGPMRFLARAGLVARGVLPWLLVAVAIGLIMFGAYSCCEARWRRF